ncbi:MAG: glutamine cyclotransferase [Myxococcales bacterium]
MPSRAAKRKLPEAAVIEREYGPFPDLPMVHGVTFDGESGWFAAGDRIQSFDPKTGALGRAIPVAADAGTAFDGKHLFQIAAGRIQKIDPESGRVLSSIEAPGGASGASGLTWAEGSLWIGQYGARKILRIDPESGRILRTIESDRFVTGITFAVDELWHGTLEDGESELRHVDVNSGEVLERLLFPEGVALSGLEAGPTEHEQEAPRFLCGGEKSGKIRLVRRRAARASD